MSEQKEERKMTFRIDGGFITQLAREQCHIEGRFEYSVELLMSCMETEQLSKREIRHMAIDILNGEAELHGIYPGEDYGFRYLEEKDDRWSIDRTLKKNIEENRTNKENIDNLATRYNYISENISEYQYTQLSRGYEGLYNERLFELDESNAIDEEPLYTNMLESFMKRQKCNTEDDYGWLEPNGTFHAVEWGEHQKWAYEWLEKNLPEEEFEKLECKYRLYEAGDELTKRGWVLLHNPAQGIANITKSEERKMTKAQRDFLYGYYIDRDCPDEANTVMEL